MDHLLWLLAACLAFLALVLLLWSQWSQRRSGLPSARIMFSDGSLRPWSQPLYDPDLGLTGKPDYVVALSEEVWVPVEVKSGRTPREPYPGHVYQVVAYALLVRRVLGKQVPFAILRYPETTFRIEITPQRETALLALLDRMRHYQRDGRPPGRSHTSPLRCARCGFRAYCSYRLEMEGES